jgi:3-hydroxybutyryl-CoA dehydrogenase
MDINTLSVIGAGTMGTGIAQIAAQAGLRVSIIDTAAEVLGHSEARLRKSLAGAVQREKLTAEQADAVAALISWGTGYEPVAEADWVIEAVIEDPAVKAGVLGQVAEWARPDAPVSSNTSTLVIRELGEMFGQPERFLGTHFFNPPPAMKLVEIIPGEKTLPEITEAALSLCERMGKTPLLSPDIPGFVVNRALAALVAAAVDIRAHGGDAAAIDQSMQLGLGHKMGPLKTADLVGLDIMLAIFRSLETQTGDPRFAAPPELVALVDAGKLGVKSGEGFYNYQESGA